MTKNKVNKIHPILACQKNNEYYTPKNLVDSILEFLDPKLKFWIR